ncbi:MAG: hypothetical protein LIO86_04970 [Lachnospiraceae bacterium]|nr:hypothetical protein [Lachnospiraceae bacterium]
MANEIEVFSFVYGNAWLLYGWGLSMAEYDGQDGFSWKREIENAISEEINV